MRIWMRSCLWVFRSLYCEDWARVHLFRTGTQSMNLFASAQKQSVQGKFLEAEK